MELKSRETSTGRGKTVSTKRAVNVYTDKNSMMHGQAENFDGVFMIKPFIIQTIAIHGEIMPCALNIRMMKMIPAPFFKILQLFFANDIWGKGAEARFILGPSKCPVLDRIFQCLLLLLPACNRRLS